MSLGCLQARIPLLERGVRAQHARLDVGDVIALQNGMLQLVSVAAGPLTFSSLCSGSDLFVYVLEVISRFYEESYGYTFDWKHLYSAEVVEYKRNFINETFGPVAIFGDINHLIGECALNTLTGKALQIPRSHVLLAGTECVSWSTLNKNFHLNKGIVLIGEGKSGSTAATSMKVIEEKRHS